MENYKYNNLDELNLIFPNYPEVKLDIEIVNSFYQMYKSHKPILDIAKVVGMIKYLLNINNEKVIEEEGIKPISCYNKLYEIYCYIFNI